MKTILAKLLSLFPRKTTPILSKDQNQLNMKHAISIPFINTLPDEELKRLNELLPWAAFIIDEKGRTFGQNYSNKKRNNPQEVPDYRALILDEKIGLKDKTVLEVGCFEGIHTVGLAQKGAIVTAFDSRIEHIVKTIVRCHAFNVNANICYWNVENEKPQYIEKYDIVHHVGVLYHLLNPLEHLKEIAPCIKNTLLLDTHVASLSQKMEKSVIDGFEYRYYKFQESGRNSPFAGMETHAKWIYTEDLINYLKSIGFMTVEILEKRDERNGDRILLLANK